MMKLRMIFEDEVIISMQSYEKNVVQHSYAKKKIVMSEIKGKMTNFAS